MLLKSITRSLKFTPTFNIGKLDMYKFLSIFTSITTLLCADNMQLSTIKEVRSNVTDAEQVITKSQNVANDFTVRVEEGIAPKLYDWLIQGLKNHAEKHAIHDSVKRYSIEIIEKDECIGALSGETLYGSIYIENIYISPQHRSKGLGRILIEKASELGKKWNCTLAVVETMSFQALEFYQKLGFTVDFAREGYTNNSTLYYLHKKI